MRLLIIGSAATDIFIYNYVKWVKTYRPDIDIDVFGFNEENQQLCPTEEYANVYTVKYNTWYSSIKCLGWYLKPFFQKKVLESFLEGRMYDIIHCHRILSSTVMVKTYKQHCKKLFCTFWGSEEVLENILRSKRLYRKKLDVFLENVDYIANSNIIYLQKVYGIYSNINYRKARFGAAPLDSLSELLTRESKTQSKELLSMPNNKYSVMIGYSGKPLHQHIKIIKELKSHNDLKSHLHLIVSMTRGASGQYTSDVQRALEESGYSYTLLSGKFLFDEDIARLRNATDIVLQLSVSDAFSRSIVESLCAKSIVIYGSWLNDNYLPHFEEEKLQAVSTNSIEDACSILSDIINGYDKYLDMLEANKIYGFKSNLWRECIQDWLNIYNEALS